MKVQAPFTTISLESGVHDLDNEAMNTTLRRR